VFDPDPPNDTGVGINVSIVQVHLVGPDMIIGHSDLTHRLKIISAIASNAPPPDKIMPFKL